MNKILTPEILAMYLGRPVTLTVVKEVSAWTEGEAWVAHVQPTHINWLAEGSIDATLHLRTLDSITEEEARALYKLDHGEEFIPNEFELENYNKPCLRNWFYVDVEQYLDNYKFLVGSPKVWLQLLAWGFDLFGLIKNGEAIDINSVQVKETEQ